MPKINRIENDTLFIEYGEDYIIYYDGSNYKGKLKTMDNGDIIRDGDGVMNYADGKSSYNGYYKDNVKHGHGKFIYNNGDTYEGEFMNGVRCGKGKYTSLNDFGCFIYEGEWKNDVRHGFGKCLYKEKYNNDAIDNDGIEFYEEEFEGYWIDDKKNGKGEVKIRGLWSNDKSIIYNNKKDDDLTQEVTKHEQKKEYYNITCKEAFYNMFPPGEKYEFY